MLSSFKAYFRKQYAWDSSMELGVMQANEIELIKSGFPY